MVTMASQLVILGAFGGTVVVLGSFGEGSGENIPHIFKEGKDVEFGVGSEQELVFNKFLGCRFFVVAFRSEILGIFCCQFPLDQANIEVESKRI